MHRRQLLAATVAALTRASARADPPPADLATIAAKAADGLGVCRVAFASITAGVAQRADELHRCAEAPSAAAIYQAASLSKPVFAYLVLKLVEQEILALDVPMARYLPEGYRHRQNLFALNQPPIEDLFPVADLQRMTARMILTHSSGLPNWASDAALSVAFEPGTDWRYSGEGYVLLQRAVEAVTGQSLEDLARRLVFAPMGMQHTSYRLSKAVAERLVAGRTASTASSRATRPLRFPEPIASGSLYTSADDYAAFMATVLRDKGLTARVIDGAVNVSRRLGLRWGLGWGVEETPQGTNLWHWGSNPGYRSLAMASLQSGNGIVVFTNDDRGMPVARSLVQAGLPGEHGALRFAMLG